MIDDVINLLAASVPALVAIIVLQAVELTRALTPSHQPDDDDLYALFRPRPQRGARPYDWAHESRRTQ